MIETSVREGEEQAKGKGRAREPRCECCGVSSAVVPLMNGGAKGWDKPFYCLECNPRFALATSFLGRL